MYNETLKSFVDSGKIVSYKMSSIGNWTGSEEGPQPQWVITIRRSLGDLILENLRRELQSALNSTLFRFIDVNTGLDPDRETEGAVVLRYIADTDAYSVSCYAPDGRLIASEGSRDRNDILNKAKGYATAWGYLLIDQTVTPQSVTTPIDLEAEDNERSNGGDA